MSDDYAFFIHWLGFETGTAAPPIVLLPTRVPPLLFFVLELEVYQPGAAGTASYTLGRGAHPRGSSYLTPVQLESTDTLRASDTGYRSLKTDGIGVQVYPAVLDQAFEIDRHISLDPGQAGAATFGSVKLTNLGRRYDAYVQTRNCDARPVRLLVGTKPWDSARGLHVDPSYGTLQSFFAGTAEEWSLTEATLEIPLRDPTYLADRPLLPDTYAGTGGLAGGSDLAGRRIPMTFGGTAASPVLAVPLIAVDQVALIYQWTDGPGTVVTLYAGQAAVFVYDGDVSDLYDGTAPTIGHYRTCNAKGLLQVGRKPVKVLTADVTGSFATAGAITTAVGLARYILTETLAISAGSLDISSFVAADAAYPFTAGLYIADDTKALDVVQTILGSVGARLITTRSGMLSVFVLRKPYSTALPVARLSTQNVVDVARVGLPSAYDPPPYRVRVGYGHINQTQTNDFDGAVTDDRKALVANPFSYASWLSSNVQRTWRQAKDPAPIATALLMQLDALKLANAVGELFEGRPGVYTVEMPIGQVVGLDLGSVVILDWPLGELAGGKVGLIVGEQVRSYDAAVTFTVLACGAGSFEEIGVWDESNWDEALWDA